MLATLRHIAAIAHSGGLAGLDHVDALCAVRRPTLQYWNSRQNEADGRITVVDAMYASSEAGE